MTESLEINVGADVRAQIESDLKLEIEAVAMYNRFVQLARDAGEGHVDWLEAQAHQMKELGYERYLSQQIREE